MWPVIWLLPLSSLQFLESKFSEPTSIQKILLRKHAPTQFPVRNSYLSAWQMNIKRNTIHNISKLGFKMFPLDVDKMMFEDYLNKVDKVISIHYQQPRDLYHTVHVTFENVTTRNKLRHLLSANTHINLYLLTLLMMTTSTVSNIIPSLPTYLLALLLLTLKKFC